MLYCNLLIRNNRLIWRGLRYFHLLRYNIFCSEVEFEYIQDIFYLLRYFFFFLQCKGSGQEAIVKPCLRQLYSRKIWQPQSYTQVILILWTGLIMGVNFRLPNDTIHLWLIFKEDFKYQGYVQITLVAYVYIGLKYEFLFTHCCLSLFIINLFIID